MATCCDEPALRTGWRQLSRASCTAINTVGNFMDQRSNRRRSSASPLKVIAPPSPHSRVLYADDVQVRDRSPSSNARSPTRQTPGTPITASYAVAHEQGTPDDANCGERLRDDVLGWFIGLNNCFVVLAVFSIIGVIFFGVFIAVDMFNVMFGINFAGLGDYFPKCQNQTEITDQYIADNPGTNASEIVWTPGNSQYTPYINGQYIAGSCTLGQWWFNVCIKGFVIIFSYVNFLPIPWRISIAVHVCAFWKGARSCAPGLDFYGRPTHALFFHIGVNTRRHIAFWLNLGWISHFICLATHCFYWTYMANQTMPGIVATMLPFAMAIVCPIVGGCIQTHAEDKLVQQHPGKFPPRLPDYLKVAFANWRTARQEARKARKEGHEARKDGTVGALFMVHVRQQFAQLKSDEAAWRETHGAHINNHILSNIVHDSARNSHTEQGFASFKRVSKYADKVKNGGAGMVRTISSTMVGGSCNASMRSEVDEMALPAQVGDASLGPSSSSGAVRLPPEAIVEVRSPAGAADDESACGEPGKLQKLSSVPEGSERRFSSARASTTSPTVAPHGALTPAAASPRAVGLSSSASSGGGSPESFCDACSEPGAHPSPTKANGVHPPSPGAIQRQQSWLARQEQASPGE